MSNNILFGLAKFEKRAFGPAKPFWISEVCDKHAECHCIPTYQYFNISLQHYVRLIWQEGSYNVRMEGQIAAKISKS